MTLILGLLQRWLSADASRSGATGAGARPLRAAAMSHTAARPLRVVRLVDRRYGASRHDGRVLISGGIDAVCAELDRLAALEERSH